MKKIVFLLTMGLLLSHCYPVVNNPVIPFVSTGTITNITTTTATCSAIVKADGGAAITTRGVCWSTSENPTTSNSKTTDNFAWNTKATDGKGLGAYTSNITGLSPNTTYYVRAYATNSQGTAYGDQRTFTSNALTPPSVTIAHIINITTTTADCSGNVISDGGASVSARGVCWNTSDNPTTSNSKTTDGTGVGSYTSNITGLSSNTTYYVRAYATNSVGTAYGEQRNFRTQQEQGPVFGSFSDSRDGHQYKTVTIGEQVWMAENLAYLHSVVGPATVSKTDPYYYVYDYYSTDVVAAKATTFYALYGVLYNWPAALTACPEGWHLPSDAEWTQLENYLIANGYNYDGSTEGNKIAKSMAANSGWTTSSYTGAVGNTDYPAYRNKSGFTALPGGYRDNNEPFYYFGNYGYWWSSTETDASYAWYRSLYSDLSGVIRLKFSKDYGFSVRCLRDSD